MSESCPLCNGTLEEVNKQGFNSHKTGAHARLFKDGKMVKVHPIKCVNCGWYPDGRNVSVDEMRKYG